MSPNTANRAPTRWSMLFGVVIFVAALGAYLYGETQGIDTSVIWLVSGPILVALFIGTKVDDAKSAAEQAAAQTNGMLDPRIQSAVARALADRDAARTRQAQGDISAPPPPPGTTYHLVSSPASPSPQRAVDPPGAL